MSERTAGVPFLEVRAAGELGQPLLEQGRSPQGSDLPGAVASQVVTFRGLEKG